MMNTLIIDLKITNEARRPVATLEEFLQLPEKNPAVFIDSHEDIENIKDFTPQIELIELNFPTFTDGRSYSSANILRHNFGYTSELRAVGDIRIDQLEQMVRCGFNAFHLNEDQNIELGLEKLKGFSFSYQPAFNREPLFRQR